MVHSKVGKSYPIDWKRKLKRLVADKDQQEVLLTIEESFNQVKDSPLQLKLFKFNLN